MMRALHGIIHGNLNAAAAWELFNDLKGEKIKSGKKVKGKR